MTKRLLVFPNDPLILYVNKGEIKPRYYNPGNLFDEIHCITFTDQEADSHSVQPLFGNASVQLHPMGKLNPIYYYIRFQEQWARLLATVTQINPHCIRAYNSDLIGFLAARLGHTLGIPMVFSNHIDPDEFAPDQSKNWKLKIWWWFSKKIYEPYSLRHATKIINVTHFLNNYCQRHGVPSHKTEVIYNKVYARQFAISRNYAVKTTYRLLTVGKLCSQKSPATIIQALCELPNVRLTLIGNGEDYVMLKRLAQTLKVSTRVEFIRSVPHREIQRHYAESDLFALASHYEGFCIPVLEAMASGLPIVVNHKEPLPEVLGECGLVVPNTPSAFASAIRYLINHRAERERFGQLAIQRARSLDGDLMEQREKALYEGILNPSS